MLLLASALAFISFGQLIVLLTGGIDLSVGPLSGPRRRHLSRSSPCEGQGTGADFLLGCLAFGVAVAVGLINGVLVRIVRIAAR